MKKVLFIFAILFAVVCYASPPQSLLPDIVTDDVGWVVQYNQTINNVVFEANLPVTEFVVQEVAYSYIGDLLVTDVVMNENYTIAYSGNTNSEKAFRYNVSFSPGDSC